MRALGAVFIVLVGACVESSQVTCGDGRVCPPGLVCDDVHAMCVRQQQIDDCTGVADETPCDAAGMAGRCRDNVCLAERCGDGFVSGSEQCDGSVPAELDDCTEHDYQTGGVVTCRTDCTFNLDGCEGRCGDGIINGDEVCDHNGQVLGDATCLDFAYYQPGGLKCSQACTFDVSDCEQNCGDGVRNGDEDCDSTDLGSTTCTALGFYVATGLACNDACSFDTSSCTGFCGDRVASVGKEVCDGRLTDLAQTCVGFGFEQGALECSLTCGPDITGCSSPEQQAWPVTVVEQDVSFDDIHGSAPNNAIAIGCQGASPCLGYAAHWNGTAWSPKTVPTAEHLHAVWTVDATHAYGVGENGAIIHYDGTSWATATSPTGKALHDIWGTSTSNLYAVGDSGTVIHYNGTSWADVVPAHPSSILTILGVWGIGSTLYVVGDTGRIWKLSGGAWTQETSNSTATLRDIWGVSAREIYVVGDSATILRYDGTTWTPMSSGTGPTQIFFGVGGSGSGDVYAVGTSGVVRHFDGVSWEPMSVATTGQQLYSAWAAGPREIYTTGTGGSIARFTGAGWARLDNPSTQSVNGLYRAPDAIVTAGPALSEISIGTVTNQPVMAGISGSGNLVFAVGNGGAIRQRTASLTWATVTSPVTTQLNDISYPIAVGSGGVILRHENNQWVPMTSPTTGNLRRVWAYSDSVAFAITPFPPAIYRLTNGTWQAMTSPTNSLIWDIWGTSPADVFLAGDEGRLFHYNGTTWTRLHVPANTPLFGISGTGPADVYVAADTSILHYDGLRWSPVRAPLLDDVVSADGTLIGGNGGSVLARKRYCKGTETTCNDDLDEDCDGYYDCGDSDCAASAACNTGGLCSGAATLACNSSVTGDTATGLQRLSRYACTPFNEYSRELVYQVTPTTSGTVTLTLDAARDLDLIVLAEGAGGGCEYRNPGCLAASSQSGGDETVTFTAMANETYYVVVDGFGANAGTFDLAISCP